MVLYRELTNAVEARCATTTIDELYSALERRGDDQSNCAARHHSLAINWSESGELPREIDVNHLRPSQTKTKP
jgi:hypothetical protein